MKAYDSDSGIANVRSTAYFYDEADGYYSGFGFDFSYDEESGYWVGSLDLYEISDTDGLHRRDQSHRPERKLCILELYE